MLGGTWVKFEIWDKSPEPHHSGAHSKQTPTYNLEVNIYVGVKVARKLNLTAKFKHSRVFFTMCVNIQLSKSTGILNFKFFSLYSIKGYRTKN